MNTEGMGLNELKEYLKSLIDLLNEKQLDELLTWCRENLNLGEGGN